MLVFTGTLHRRNGFYTMYVLCICYCPTPTLHLNLALTGDCAFLPPPPPPPKKKNTYKTLFCMILSVLNNGDTENVLINPLLIIILMSLTHARRHARTHAHRRSQAHTHTHSQARMHLHTHTHTHIVFPCFMGTFHRCNGFYTVQTVFYIALHLNLPSHETFMQF